jgi:hypothetical protein
MDKKSRYKSGIQLLLKKYRKLFRTPENFDHYSETDFRRAERKLTLEELKYLFSKQLCGVTVPLFHDPTALFFVLPFTSQGFPLNY